MARTLDELEVINKLLGGHKVVIDGLKQILRSRPKASVALRIADLGCGGGDMLRILARWGRKNNVPIELTGIDANAFIIEYAREKSSAFPEIQYQQADIFSDAFGRQKYDVVLCSLFCHHFTDEQLMAMFRRLKKQSSFVLINDLHRHWFAYHSIKWLTYMLSHSPLIRNDAPLSVARAFRRRELSDILLRAGIADYQMKWMWAFRYQVIF